MHSVLRQQKKFSSWYVIETLIDESPAKIVHALVDSKSFELLNNWQELYPMSLEHYVVSLFGTGDLRYVHEKVVLFRAEIKING